MTETSKNTAPPDGERSFDRYTDRVTRGEDDVCRWYYDMDMYQNKSMLYLLLRVNLFTFLGVTLAGALFVGFMQRDFGAPMVRGIVVIGLALLAGMSVLYVIGFYLAAWIKGGRYRVHYVMREDGIELVWSASVKKGMETGRQILALAGAAAGSRRLRGRWRPTLDEVSNARFSKVLHCKSCPKWDMIDLFLPGGKFQVYVGGADFDRVEAFIRERIPERAR